MQRRIIKKLFQRESVPDYKMFPFLISILSCQISATKHDTNESDEKIQQSKREEAFWGRSTRLRASMELNYSSSNLPFCDMVSRNQNCYCGEILNLFVIIFFSLVDISFLSSLWAVFSFYCKTMRQVYSKPFKTAGN